MSTAASTERAVGPLPEIRRHRVRGVAQEGDATVGERRRVDALYTVHEQIVDGRDSPQQRTGRSSRTDDHVVAQPTEVAGIERRAHPRCVGVGEEVRGAVPEWRRAEEPEWGPELRLLVGVVIAVG